MPLQTEIDSNTEKIGFIVKALSIQINAILKFFHLVCSVFVSNLVKIDEREVRAGDSNPYSILIKNIFDVLRNHPSSHSTETQEPLSHRAVLTVAEKSIEALSDTLQLHLAKLLPKDVLEWMISSAYDILLKQSKLVCKPLGMQI